MSRANPVTIWLLKRLLGHTSSDCSEKALKVLRILKALRELDPDNCPATPAWVSSLAGETSPSAPSPRFKGRVTPQGRLHAGQHTFGLGRRFSGKTVTLTIEEGD